jgi:hypothetical protein
MAYSAPPNSVFQIEDDDLEVSAVGDDSPPSDSKQSTENSRLIHNLQDAAGLAVGTAGCCGAVFLSCGCLCCGQCHDELVDTYNRFTLCGRWWPVG